MTFKVKVRTASQVHEYVLELSADPDLKGMRQGTLQLHHNGQSLEVDWAQVSSGVFSILIRGQAYQAHVVRLVQESAERTGAWAVTLGNAQARVEVHDQRSRPTGRPTRTPSGGEDPQEIRAPMPGKIVKVLVREDQDVSPGQELLVIEAMKMQNELRAPRAGRVQKVYVQEGKGVETGAPLVRLA